MTEILQQPKMSDKVARFMSGNKKMLIGGDWVEAVSGRYIDVMDPATGDRLSGVPEGGKEDVDRAVVAARRAFETGPWPNMSPLERSRILWKIGDLIMENCEELAEIESLDNGKMLSIARIGDVPMAADMFHYMAGWPTKHHGLTIPLSIPNSQFHAYTLNEPIGVVGQIIPWNFPLLMAAWKIAPALATGCTTILKPAEDTSLSALRFGALLQEAGLPDGVVNIVTGYGETAGAAIAAHPDIDKIAFTGSTEVGKSIVTAAAGNLKKVSLELGGKSPNIVLKDADIDLAIEGSAHAIFFNHGQGCVAGSRLFVEDSIFDRVVEGVAEIANKTKLGGGLNPETEMGPLISDKQYERVYGYIDSGKQQGAEVICGGERFSGNGYFAKPTIFVNVKDDMDIVKEEIFGPVVVAMPFSQVDDDLIKRANDTKYGLASGIWTRDISKAHKLAERLRSGAVWINSYHVFDAALPFGGYKQSGWGREMGKAVLDNYTEMKSIACRL